MPLSWNEIKTRAVKFSKEWQDTSNEEADAKPFLEVLDTRKEFPNSSLADLYDPLTMPPALSTALSGGRQGLIWMTDPTIYNTVWSHTGGWFGCETAFYICKEEKWSILLFINWTTADMVYSVGFFPVLVQMVKYAQVIVGIEDELNEVPTEFSLLQNYPNPFNPSTKISWQAPVSSHQTIRIYDVLGNEVATLVDEFREAGRYEIEFDATSLSSGIYFYRLQAGSFVQTRKMILLK